ncbi:MAG: hypothetical protein LBE61_17090 [Burkholderiaceae bacterium]|nr:hypothetical protein [Burkholderiaceae bacterium]
MTRYRRRNENAATWFGWSAASVVFALAAYGIYYQFVVHTVNKMSQDLIESTNSASQKALARSRELQLEQQRQREEKEAKETAAVEAQLRIQRLVQAKLQQKEKAWEAYYKPTRKCIEDPITTECANAHIRARNAFEASYKDPD